MATNIDQNTAFENNVVNLANVKSAGRNEIEKKFALGDIKNAPLQPISGGKSEVKKVQSEINNEGAEPEFASSKYIDYLNVWAEKKALSDDEINKWAMMLVGSLNPHDDDEPPPLPPVNELDDEIMECFPKYDGEDLVAPPFDLMLESPEPFDIPPEIQQRPNEDSFFDDSHNQSVFELDVSSDDDNMFAHY